MAACILLVAVGNCCPFYAKLVRLVVGSFDFIEQTSAEH